MSADELKGKSLNVEILKEELKNESLRFKVNSIKLGSFIIDDCYYKEQGAFYGSAILDFNDGVIHDLFVTFVINQNDPSKGVVLF